MSQAKIKVTITVPAAVVTQLQNPQALREWLQAHGLWSPDVYDSRMRQDPLSLGTIIELEVRLPVGEKE